MQSSTYEYTYATQGSNPAPLSGSQTLYTSNVTYEIGNPSTSQYVASTTPAYTATYTTPAADTNLTYSYTREANYENPAKASYTSTTGGAEPFGALGGLTAAYTNTPVTYTSTYETTQPVTYTSTYEVTQPVTYTSTYEVTQPVTYTSTYEATTTPAVYTSQTASYGTGAAALGIPITSESVYTTTKPAGIATSTYIPAAVTEVTVTKVTTYDSPKKSQIGSSRASGIQRESLLSPYRQTLYPEFDLVEDLPERKNLIFSINYLLQKSPTKENLLTSPTKVSIKRDKLLSPAKIHFESPIKMKDEQGAVYEGEGTQGDMHGKGKITYADGRQLEGEFQHGRLEGNGVLRFKTGKVCYEGGFSNSQFNGQGVLQCEAPIPLTGAFDYYNFDHLGNRWTKYEGEFRNGKKNGSGTLTLSNGDTFVGEFRDDKVEGRGTYTPVNGQAVQGLWSNNRFSSAL